jgi:hypothetical protein
MRYLIGRRIRYTVTLTDYDTGAPADPENLTLTFHNLASGARITYEWPISTEIVHDGVGAFHADITLPEAGRYWYRWHCPGAVEEAGEDDVIIEASRVLA